MDKTGTKRMRGASLKRSRAGTEAELLATSSVDFWIPAEVCQLD